MKKVLFAACITLLMAACADMHKTEENASAKNDEAKALYEKNLATLKAYVAAFEKEDINGVIAQIADSFKWNGPGYGDTVHTRAHFLEAQQFYMNNWDSLHLTHANYLPGVDSATHEFDGSVRYYGVWEGVHTSGVRGKVDFYGTYEFNSANKLIHGGDYFDLGGLLNSVQPKAQ